jgi:hypothetical protein
MIKEILSLFRQLFNPQKKFDGDNILKHFQKGKLNVHPALLDGFLLLVKCIIGKGFNYTDINEITSLGQMMPDPNRLEAIKNDFSNGNFHGLPEPKVFDVNQDYINFYQFVLDNEMSYALAYYCPANYVDPDKWVLWIVELKKPLDKSTLQNANLEYKKLT